MSLTSHPYKTRSQTTDGSSDTSGATVSVATSENITNLETKLLSRFGELTKDVKDVIIKCKRCIIKNLQAESEPLREKVCSLESKVTSLEIDQNKLEQYGRINNIEVSGIPDSVKDNCLEEKLFLCLLVLVSK